MDEQVNQQVHRQVRDEAAIRFQELFSRFLKEYRDADAERRKYRDQLDRLLEDAESTTLDVSMDDLMRYNEQLYLSIENEYYRVLPYLQKAAEQILLERGGQDVKKEVYIALTNCRSSQTVRSLRADHVGLLSSLKGQVVRTHPVMPELVEGIFCCLECNTVQPPVSQQFTYTQPKSCVNQQCFNRLRWHLDLNKSTFVDFQKIRIQESHDELPRGSIPRSLDVIVRGDAVEKAQAGDRVEFTGTLIVVPDVSSMIAAGSSGGSKTMGNDTSLQGVSGLSSLGVKELTHKFAFLAYSVESTDSKAGGKVNAILMQSRSGERELTKDDIKELLDAEDWNNIRDMLEDEKLLQNICKSLFPSIHGHDEVKKGIALMLVGGVPKRTFEGTQLRGDINCCLVGDPSTAKSQLLKSVEGFSPRCIYTSGKASSAAGLTAAVVKDEESGEFTIEAGALLLADNGIACIDEFDKMDIKDQVAIHEAMEQQTITITKAGVKATLKARTSILAAANPVGGRYDKTKQLRHNISLTAPIMSRFDLFFVLVDEPNELMDYAIAESIVNLHSHDYEEHFEQNKVYSIDLIRKYILWTKLTTPTISQAAEKLLCQEYRKMRERDAGGASSSWRITVRQLESMIRLSEALARIYAKDVVQENHVREAARLLSRSIVQVEMPDLEWDDMDIEGMTLEDDEENAATAATEEPDKENQPPPTSEQKPHEETNASPQKTKSDPVLMTHNEFLKIRMLLLQEVRKREELVEAADEDENVDPEAEPVADAYTRESLSHWFLELMEDADTGTGQVGDDEELRASFGAFQNLKDITKRLKLVDKIISKLLNSTNLIELETEAGEGEQEGAKILVVNPNLVLNGDM